MTRSGSTVGGSSVFEITQSLDEESAFRIKRLLEGGVKIPPQPRRQPPGPLVERLTR